MSNVTLLLGYLNRNMGSPQPLFILKIYIILKNLMASIKYNDTYVAGIVL